MKISDSLLNVAKQNNNQFTAAELVEWINILVEQEYLKKTVTSTEVTYSLTSKGSDKIKKMLNW